MEYYVSYRPMAGNEILENVGKRPQKLKKKEYCGRIFTEKEFGK